MNAANHEAANPKPETGEGLPAADPAGAPDDAPLDAGADYRISIPGDAVMGAVNRLVTAGTLDEAGKGAILWFYGHVRAANMSLADAGACIDRDASTVHRLFNGRYGAKYDAILISIARYRKLAEQRAKRRDIGYIETTTWKKVNAVCNAALFDGLPAYIYGASQIGKTAALQEFARRNNHGQTRYMRMPAAPTCQNVLRYMADASYISYKVNECELRRRLCSCLDNKTLLIVDEFHQAMIGCSDLTGRKIVEFFREVYDRSGCGIVMAGTKVFRDEIEKGRQAMIYDQFRRRGMIELTLPDSPPRADVVKIAAAFGLPDPDEASMEVIAAMLKESGTGKYIKFLQLANGLAVGRKQKLAWEHFVQAHRSIAALSKG